jgi:hypothetical protein
MQTGYQVESQSESLSAVTIAFAQNPKDFQPSNNIFDLHALACQLPIRLLFAARQLMQFAVFLRQNHIQRFGLQTPISQIGAQFQVLAKSNAALLKQFVIVVAAFAEKCCRDLLAFFFNDELRFQTVPLFLAAVKGALFFFGRSISLSVTSTIVYLIESPSSSRFLPGKENLPDLIKISSTRRTIRDTFERVPLANHVLNGTASGIHAKTRALARPGFQLINYFSCRVY